MSNFQLFYSDQVGGGSPTGPDPENIVGGQDIGCSGRLVFLGCKCPVNRCIVVQEQNHIGENPKGFSLQNVPQLHQQG